MIETFMKSSSLEISREEFHKMFKRIDYAFVIGQKTKNKMKLILDTEHYTGMVWFGGKYIITI